MSGLDRKREGNREKRRIQREKQIGKTGNTKRKRRKGQHRNKTERKEGQRKEEKKRKR